ncbi:hypothetical protein ACJMK2_020133 [Sinanodonta woodiana]|uniref:Uncharacterized protein n=1 Tax=Sinanodonta woodiana TaxID=1069815 RepID=A0ABD3U0M5_SINWO
MKFLTIPILISMVLCVFAESRVSTVSSSKSKRSIRADPVLDRILGRKVGYRPYDFTKRKRSGLDDLYLDDLWRAEPMADVKNDLSNEIPVVHSYHEDEQPQIPVDMKANRMIDDFILFLTMRDAGLLDMCLGRRR